MNLSALPARLRSKLAEAPSGCWEWNARLDDKGYAIVNWQQRSSRAHRVVYELLVGPIPAGLTIDHLCLNKRCVRPDHLEPVTSAENTRRRDLRGHYNAVRTMCRRGHPFDETNTYLTPDGRRQCRACVRLAKARYEQRKAS